MRYSKRKVFTTLFLGLILFSLFINLFLVRGKSALADITYTLNNDVLFNSNNPLTGEFNLRNPIIYSENYSGSYSFENDTIGSTPLGWEDNSGGGCSIEVISDLVGHNKVLDFIDVDGANAWSNNYLDSGQDYGTIDFWYQSTDITKSSYIQFYNVGTLVFYIYIEASQWKYNGVGAIPNIVAPINDKWYHIQIHFECTGGSYQGLAQYRFEVIGNGVSSGALTFSSNEAEFTILKLLTHSASSGYHVYADAIGYSWLSNYTIGANLFPITETNTDTYEVSRYEFALSDINTFNPFLHDDPNGWTDIELPAGDKVGVVDEVDGSFDKLISVSSAVSGDNRGIEKDDFNINGTFINVSFGMIFKTMDGVSNQFYMKVYSSTDVLSTQIFVDADLSIYYSDFASSVDTGIDVQIGVANVRYDFNVLMDYEINRAFLIIRENEVVIGTFDYTLMNVGHEGVGIITIKETIVANELMFVFIDYVGIYSHGVAQAVYGDAFGISDIPIGDNWNLENNNLVEMIGNGTFNLGVISGAYTDSSALTELVITSVYDNTTRFFNVYDLFVSEIATAHLLITVIGKYFGVSYFNIEGVRLLQGVNVYPLIYTHDNIVVNDSYFYLDAQNRLRFTIDTDDADLEYIQAEFNITDVSSDDFAIKFRSDIDDKAFGYFRVNFTDISNFIPLPIFDTTTRVFITQNKTISSFIILITDEDVDTITGITDGYVSEIELLYVAGIGVSITTSNLLTIIIPIIMIFVPTFLLSSRIGKNMIVPLMMLMSLICVVSGIIPLWLFFIIIVPASLFLFLKRKEALM